MSTKRNARALILLGLVLTACNGATTTDGQGPTSGGTASTSGGATVCVDNVLCIQGSHWDSTQCKCISSSTTAAGGMTSMGGMMSTGGMSAQTSSGSACVDNVLCIQGSHWDSTQCKCVSSSTTAAGGMTSMGDTTSMGGTSAKTTTGSACVDNVLCIQGSHWDNTQCKCVPSSTTAAGGMTSMGGMPSIGGMMSIGGMSFRLTTGTLCIDTVLCIQGFHWDGVLCKCTAN